MITPYLVIPSGGGGVQVDTNGVETKIPFKTNCKRSEVPTIHSGCTYAK